MNDLAGLNWDSSTKPNKQSTPSSTSNANYFPTLKTTPPVSGRSTPSLVSRQASQNKIQASSNAPSKSSTPANDSFANLVPFHATQSTKGLSLQEQQKLLHDQRTKQEEEKQRQWDVLSNSASPNLTGIGLGNSDRVTATEPTVKTVVSPPTYSATSEYGGQRLSSTVNKPFASLQGQSSPLTDRNGSAESEEDILAAFNSAAPVDNSSNFPIPEGSRSTSVGPPSNSIGGHAMSGSHAFAGLDDDDPFDLGSSSRAQGTLPQAHLQSNGNDEEDVLGLLGKPVSKLPPRTQSPAVSNSEARGSKDKAIAELVEMGFSIEKSQEALASTESGQDVQGAVGWLLSQAHAESRGKPQRLESGNGGPRSTSATGRPGLGRTTSSEVDASMPAWMRQQGRSASRQGHGEIKSPANGEKDPAKIAQELGNNLFKTANSLWKTGAKKLNKAVADLSADNDTSQPKWMRDAQSFNQEEISISKKQNQPRSGSDEHKSKPPVVRDAQGGELMDMTDEAMMLEGGLGPHRQRQNQQQQHSRAVGNVPGSSNSSRGQSPFASQLKVIPSSVVAQGRSKINRQALEEENVHAYISPARRKKPAPKPAEPEPDLLVGGSQVPTSMLRVNHQAAASQSSSSSKPSSRSQPQPQPQIRSAASVPIRPKALHRTIPPISSIALQSSTSHRLSGNAAFKLGNYADATVSYGNSLRDLPIDHPLTILLLTNRALTNLKTGDPKACIVDAEAALLIIGPARGAGETIAVGGVEGDKDMAPFWGKAMMRRAEALEQLERWADAAAVWKECVEAGVGGSLSIQGRNRCERAAGGDTVRAQSVPPRRSIPKKPAPVRRSPAASKVSALDDLAGNRPSSVPNVAPSSAEAVTRLRAANAAAERAEDEKFALADSVDERLSRWRKGKEGNLRALLGSLDAVLWEGAGWKKVGMSELIVPGKVKVAYMKGIGKVHPDKLPTTASTEQVMISGAVFSTLNEAWDRFKTENGL